MADMEKVIKRLGVVTNAIVDGYIHEPDLAVNAITDAIALLKEQEAELSFRNAKPITHTATKLDDATCPSCGNVIRVRYDYCHYCGQKLDWEGR